MIRIGLGMAIMIALVGYGVITPEDIHQWGLRLTESVNTILQAGADATDTGTVHRITKEIKDL